MEKRHDKTSIMNNEVVIFKDASGSLTVFPDYVFLKKQGHVKFFAVNTAALLIIPEPEVMAVKEDREIGSKYFEIGEKGKITIKLAKPKEATPGEYPYIVFSPDTNQIRKGSSPPSMIIIDDP